MDETTTASTSVPSSEPADTAEATETPPVDVEAAPSLRQARPPATPVWTNPCGRDASRAGVLPALLAVAIYAVLAVVVFWHIWSTDPRTVSQIGGDQFTSMWFLEWLPFSLLHGHNPLFSTFANYPFGVNLLDNTSSLFLGAIAAPVTLTLGPVAAYNTMSTLALAGSASAGYFFVARFTHWRFAAFAGGLFFGFGPYEIAQSAGHTNLTFVVFPPLILLVVHEIVVRQRGRPGSWGIVLALLLTAQFFVATEVFVSTLVIAGVGVAATAIVGRRQIRSHIRYAVTGAAWAAGLGAALLAYPFWFVLRGPGHISGPIQLVPQAYRADVLAVVVPDANQRLAPAAAVRTATHFANSTAENGSYLGITLLLLLVVGVILCWRRSTVVRIAAIGALAAFVLSLGGALALRMAPPALLSGFPLPERVFTKLPLLKNTIPVRYSLYVELFAALLLGVVLDAVHDAIKSGRTRRPHARRRGVGMAISAGVAAVGVPCLLAIVVLAPVAPNIPLTAAIGPVDTPAYFTTAAVSRLPLHSTAVVYPYATSNAPNAQMWQAVASMQFRMPGGYFLVPEPPGNQIAFSFSFGYGRATVTATTLDDLRTGHPPTLTPALRHQIANEWRAWHVRSVIAFPAGTAHPAQAIAFLTALLGKPSQPEPGGGAVWYDVSVRTGPPRSG